MTSLALSLPEIAVLHAAKHPAAKSQIVSRALELAPGEPMLLQKAIDRLHLSKLLTRNDLAQYELTQRGQREVGEALASLDKFLNTLRYGVRA